MASARMCAFCPETANLTGEHLYADWIGRILTKTTSHYVFTDISAKDRKKRQWRGRHLDHTFKSVCADCNNGWMSDIDNEARDTLKDVILHHAPVSFLPRGLKSIAAFAMKNAFVADYMSASPFFSPRHRNQFRQHREFPLGTFMWLGTVATERHVKHGLSTVRYGKPAEKALNAIETCLFTWSAETLLLQVLAARWTYIHVTARAGYPQIKQDSPLNTVFLPFWPITARAITWPSRKVSQNQLDDVAARFTTAKYW